ncbi:glycosyltransferase family 2 protein [Rhodosalinus sediminis]|uniref:glycosyltransferase family 2 protein n=1 Tax=Rhodosalinus sediminis TaxID=1940533 RepID=UPI002357761D|nr:glycosyltransferase family 2 protein [Rhodosalinus sediminis]
MFDVVIPLGKDHAGWDAAIASALAQDHLAQVTVVVNGGFPEAGLPELDRRFASDIAAGRLKIVRDYTLSNGNQARTLGVRHGTAPWVAFLDSDDLWRPGWLAHVRDRIAAAPEAEMFYGSIRRTRDDGREDVRRAADWRPFRTPEHYLVAGGCAQSSAFVVRRDLLQTVRWRPLVTRRQDSFFFRDVVRHGAEVRPIPETFVETPKDSAPRVYASADILDYLLEIRGCIPFTRFSRLALRLAKRSLGSPLLLLRIAASFASLKHLDWYLR